MLMKPRYFWPAVALIAAPGRAQDAASGAKPEWPKTVYVCRLHDGQFAEFGGTLEFDTTFTEGGEVVQQAAKWSMPLGARTSDSTGPATRVVDGTHGWITIEWPTVNPWDKGTAASDPATTATVKISNFGLHREKMRKKERWYRSIVVRGSEVLVYEDDADRNLFLSPLEPALVSDFGSASSTGLIMPLANLLAWGSGSEALTIYEVFVEPRKSTPNAVPNGPAGRMRIVGEYRVNVAPLARAFEAVRARHRDWRGSLSDFRTTCGKQQMDDPSLEIIVT